MEIFLSESSTEAPVKHGKRWRVRIATPGQGSSGFYSESVLENYGPTAVPAKTKAFLGHAKPQDRSLRDLVGTYPDGAFWDAKENALFADLEPATKKWSEVLDELGPLAEASINLSGTKDEDGNVLTLEYDRANSVDLIPIAGLAGSGLTEQVESLIESARSLDSKQKPSTDSVREKEKTKMDEKILEALTALKTSFDTFVTESKATADNGKIEKANAETISTAVTEAVSTFKDKAKAIDDAKLLPSQVEALLAAAERGEDVAPLIESAKKIVDEAKNVQLEESAGGRSFGADTVTDAKQLVPAGW